MKNIVEPDLKRIQGYLDEQAEWLRNQGLEVDVVVRRGRPEEEIIELAQAEPAELIIMTSKGQSGLAVWLYGSVAERVIRHSKSSILVLKELPRSQGETS